MSWVGVEMWWWLAACQGPGPFGQGSYATLCDGCGTSSTVESHTEVQLLRAAPDSTPVTVRTWATAGSETAPLADLDGDGVRDGWVRGAGEILLSGQADVATWVPGYVTPLGDVDGDGLDDDAAAWESTGELTVLSASELGQPGTRTPDDGGPGVAGAWPGALPDLDGDGAAETLWSVWDDDADTTAFSVVAGGAPWTADAVVFTGELAGNHVYGGGPWPIGDVDGDGAEDVAVGATQRRYPGDTADLELWSGADLAAGEVRVLATLRGRDGYDEGFDAFPAGDLDGDGLGDLIAARHDAGSTELRLLYAAGIGEEGSFGATGLLLAELGWYAVVDARDLDGDGLAEVAYTGAGLTTPVHRGASLALHDLAPSWSLPPADSVWLGGIDPDGQLSAWVATTVYE